MDEEIRINEEELLQAFIEDINSNYFEVKSLDNLITQFEKWLEYSPSTYQRKRLEELSESLLPELGKLRQEDEKILTDFGENPLPVYISKLETAQLIEDRNSRDEREEFKNRRKELESEKKSTVFTRTAIE